MSEPLKELGADRDADALREVAALLRIVVYNERLGTARRLVVGR